MIPIQKTRTPHSLSQYRRDPNASFDNIPSETKKELRQSLIKEQRGICCYCMSRISLDELTRIEHWQCQSLFQDQQLDYDNMMLACHGNEDQAPEEQHCDVKKGKSPLKFNPSNPSHARCLKIHYLKDGTIESDDTDFNAQLERVLNLNTARLRENRKRVYESVIILLKREGWNRHNIRNLIQKHELSSPLEVPPYCGVTLYYLKRYLKKFKKF